MSILTLTLTDEDGTLLDQTRVSREEFAKGRVNALTARTILETLTPGEEPRPVLPDHGNRVARDGLDRCFCGCKYWENDRCVDCGAHVEGIR